jgi:4'-phosphopantetheinyl transferase
VNAIEVSLALASRVPEGDAWLGPKERAVQAKLKLPKRRSEWRLGQFVAKRLLSSLTGVADVDRIEIVAAEDGAPEAFLDDQPLSVSLSITHRSGVGACAVTEGARVGCDLEAIEPRTQRFVGDFFTSAERESIAQTDESLRYRHIALIWSAKESALKVLRVGLRRDTRNVEVDIGDPTAVGSGWYGLTTSVDPEGKKLSGWWHQDRDVVLTLVCDDPSFQVARQDASRATRPSGRPQ